MSLAMPRHRAPLTFPAMVRDVLPALRHRAGAVPTVGNAPRTDRRPIIGGMRVGQPPREQRPGYWRPGTADDVRRAVTAMAADRALSAYLSNPTDANHDALIAAQATFRAVARIAR